MPVFWHVRHISCTIKTKETQIQNYWLLKYRALSFYNRFATLISRIIIKIPLCKSVLWISACTNKDTIKYGVLTNIWKQKTYYCHFFQGKAKPFGYLLCFIIITLYMMYHQKLIHIERTKLCEQDTKFFGNLFISMFLSEMLQNIEYSPPFSQEA